MKIFAVLVLAAIVAYASADDAAAPVAEYIGDLQDTEGGDIIRIGQYTDCDTLAGDASDTTGPAHGIPSCKLGETLGNPICLGKCISRGHKGGYCKGKVCTCVG